MLNIKTEPIRSRINRQINKGIELIIIRDKSLILRNIPDEKDKILLNK